VGDHSRSRTFPALHEPNMAGMMRADFALPEHVAPLAFASGAVLAA
jgi:hypothetical protein